MGGKGGGAVSTNNQLVQMQQEQAMQATEANVERNARLAYGTKEINDIFSGHPAGATQVDLSALKQPGAGAAANWATAASNPSGMITYNGQIWNGQTWVPDPNAAQEPGALPGGYSARQMPDSGGATQYGLYDPQGNLITTGNTVADLANAKIWTGGDPSKTEGGFQPEFYDKYRQAQLDYYLPQENEQYENARSNLAYQLARAGTLNSSVAGMDIAKLAKQDQINQAQIASQADTATGQLRSTIQQDQETALNQLYSTEDPSVAASTAENMVANAQLTKPLLNPLGALFTPISIGVGTALTGYTNPYAYLANPAGGGGSTSVATSSGAQGYGGNVNASV